MSKLTFKPAERKNKRTHVVLPCSSSPISASFKETTFAAVVALTHGYLTADCVEACRRIVRRAVKKAAKMRISANPFLPLTTKPAEVRMGKGKGKIDYHVYPVSKGKVLFELSGIPFQRGKVALARTQSKLPFETRIVKLFDRT